MRRRGMRPTCGATLRFRLWDVETCVARTGTASAQRSNMHDVCVCALTLARPPDALHLPAKTWLSLRRANQPSIEGLCPRYQD